MEYAAFPLQLTKHVPPMPTVWQLNDFRIVTVKGHENDPMTLTTISDIATVVRRAIEYKQEWPEVGGISGARITANQLKLLVEKIRGKLFGS